MSFALWGALVLASPAPVDERPGLAALNIEAERGVDKSLVKMLSDAVLSQLKSSGRFASVIGSSDIQAMISMEQQKQALGCDEDNCLAQLGGALGVPYLFTGSLGSVGGRFMLNLKLLLVEEAKVDERVSKIFKDEGALVDGLSAALDELIKGVEVSDKAKEEAPAVSVKSVAGSTAKRWLGGSLVAIGVGSAFASYVVVTDAQAQHNQVQSERSADTLDSAVGTGNALLYAGLGSAVVGVAAWVW